MENAADAIEKALKVLTDSEIAVARTNADSTLSPFLRSSFDLYRVRFLGKSRLVAAPVNLNSSFQAIRKQLRLLEEATGEHVALFARSLSPTQRRALLDSRIGFICANGNVYMPEFGLSIQDVLSDGGGKALPRRFSPSEQLCFLYCLYTSSDGILQSDACSHTGLSNGSVSRAFSTFSKAGMLEYEIGGATGRLRIYRIPDKRSFYERGMTAFGDPVREVFFADKLPIGTALLESGLSALTRNSDLNPPARAVFAASPEQAKLLDRKNLEPETGWPFEVQVLRYDPAPFAKGDCVDPVTMLKTIEDDGDERVLIAIRQAMEGYSWYEG